MTPPRLRLVRPGEAPSDPATASPSPGPVPEDSPRAAPPTASPSPEPVPEDSPRATPPIASSSPEPVPEDSPRAAPSPEPAPADSPRATPLPEAGPPLRLTLAPPLAPVLAPAAALAELDALLAGDLDDPACARLAALAEQVPGRLRAVTTALARVPSRAAIVALRSLPAGAAGQLDALVRCFAHGVPRHVPVLADSTAPVPTDRVLLALEFRSSRARGFPDLVARAQALAARGPAAEFAALDVDHRRHYRLGYHAGRCPPAALAAQLRAAHLDLAWLHARLLRLRGSRLWLGGWRFDDDDPLGPAAQGHLLQAWLRWAERGPGA